MKQSLDKIFYKVVYHHIIYMCDFFVNLDDFFAVVCTSFHEDCGLHQIRSLYLYSSISQFLVRFCVPGAWLDSWSGQPNWRACIQFPQAWFSLL
jgi:hypothetical protein